MKIYRSYMFRDKDPVIDGLRTVFSDHFSEPVEHSHLVQVEKDGGPSVSAMSNWFFGKTKRPQNATIEAAGRALGYRREWVAMNAKTAKTRLRKVKG